MPPLHIAQDTQPTPHAMWVASGICELSAEGLLFFFGSASLSFKMDENQAEELRLWQTLAQNEKKGASQIYTSNDVR